MKFIPVIFLVLLVLGTSCVSKKKYDELDSKYKNLQASLRDCRSKNGELSKEKKALESQVEALKGDTTRLGRLLRDMQRQLQARNGQLADLRADYDRLKSQSSKELQDAVSEYNRLKEELEERNQRLKQLEDMLAERDRLLASIREKLLAALKEFEERGLTVYEKDGKIYVSLSDKLLFKSGKYQVNSEGKRALKELAQVLREVTEVEIFVEGHTDNVPYKGRKGTAPSDNWELSVLRATEVTKILTNDYNVAAKRVTASGHGEHLPKADNDEEEGRAKNRRTEIILVPDIQGILDQIKNKGVATKDGGEMEMTQPENVEEEE